MEPKEYNLTKYERGVKKILGGQNNIRKDDIFVINEVTYQNEKDYLMKIMLITIIIIFLLLVV